jgi:hypothetical protein
MQSKSDNGGKSTPARMQRAGVLAAALGFFALCLVGRAVAQGHDFKICEGEFALCAASTCTPTGGKITVNVIGGGTATFPEYNCTCPVFDGPAIADLAGGNMEGSCTPPQGQIWSLYQPRLQIPQAITNWSRLPSKSFAPPLACDPGGEIHGVPVATCHCPLGESIEGKAVAPNTTFVTQAGQGNTEICFDHPVAGTLPAPP